MPGTRGQPTAYPRLNPWGANLLVALAYLGTTQVNTLLAVPTRAVSAVWPASGVALAAILVLGFRVAPGIWIGALLSRLVRGYLVGGLPAVPAQLAVGSGTATAALLEALLAAWVMRRFAGPEPAWCSPPAFLVFLLPASLGGAVVGATLGLSVLLAVGAVTGSEAPLALLTWVLGDWSGILVTAPFLLAWRPGAFGLPVERHPLEAVGLGVLLVGVCMLTFGGWLPSQVDYPLAFTPMPFLVWAAYRFLQRGATLGLVTVATLAAWGTTHDHGPFSIGPWGAEGLILLQVFLVTIAVTTLALVAAVCDRRRTVLRLREATVRLDEANRTKADFIRMASHELRSPLMPLGLIADRLRYDVERGAAPEPTTVDRMERQVHRLSDLLDALLDVSRIERGALVAGRERLDLGALVARVVEDWRPQLQGRAVTYDGPADPVHVQGDSGRLEQVLQNLIENARKYAPGDTPIGVRVNAAAGEVRVAVTDQGEGIAPEAQANLFTRFYRADIEERRESAGLGLGLYISRKIVELHGGRIGVESRPGSGSTFYFVLPRVR